MPGTGGYQPPANPAPVSGPGSLARRTDGGPGASQPQMALPDAKYGEAKAFQQQQAGAPMASLSSLGAPSPQPSAAPQQPQMDLPIPLTDPTMRPGEPVTHGADAGAGPGLSSLNLPNPVGQQHATALSLVQSMVSQSPDNPTLQWLGEALSRGY